jgi:hypothetical protein
VDVIMETEVRRELFWADEEVVGDAEVAAEVKVPEVCCPDSEEDRAVTVDVSTKVEAPSEGEKDIVPWLELTGTEFAMLAAEVAMLGESAVLGSVVTENIEIVANGPSPSGMTYGSAPLLPSICISPPGPSVRIPPPEATEPCWLSGMRMPAFME